MTLAAELYSMPNATTALCLESSDLARELHSLLQSIDPARWRQDMADVARQRLDRIREQLSQILDSYEAPQQGSSMAMLYESLQNLARQMEELCPDADESSAHMKEQWRLLQTRLQPTYATVAACLEPLSKPVPKLRPTNWGRSLFHLTNSIMCLLLVQHVLDRTGMIAVACGMALFAWTAEALRAKYKGVTRFFMIFLGKFAHPHEHHRVNSSTWFCTALGIMSLTTMPLAASVGIMVLGLADPVAAIVGRRYGRTKLYASRTLEGSMAFVVTGFVISLVMMVIYYPTVGLGAGLLIAACGAVFGAVAELFSARLDDNLTIPIAAAMGATVAMQFLGI